MGWVGLGDRPEVGRAVLFANSELEKSILWDFYIDKRPDLLPSRLYTRDIADIVIDLFCSGMASRSDDVVRILSDSYYCYLNGQPVDIAEETYTYLLQNGFLIKNGDELSPTPLGQAVSITGLTAAGAEFINNVSNRCDRESDMQIVYRLAGLPEGRSIFIPSVKHGLRGEHRFSDTAEDNPLIREVTSLSRELTADETGRLRLTFLLFDWMAGMPVLDIENQYNLYPGILEHISRQSRWLLSSAASVIRAGNRYSALPIRLEQLAFSAGTGLPYRLRDIYLELKDCLFRREFLKLQEGGLVDLEQVIDASPSVWNKLILSDERRRKILTNIEELKEGKMQSCLTQVAAFGDVAPSIDIEGTPIRERFLIRINGRPISLTLKSFKYLVSLAWSRLTKDHGWLYKEELEQGFNQARYLYRLRQEIGRDFLPEWPLYENNRSGYYRLVAERDKIKINVAALSENPDYEIRKMAADLTPPIAC
jgi:hypothetical protein